MSNNIGPKIVLEGEKEYRKAINDVNREMKVLSSEMKAVSAEFDGNANSIEALRKKNDILNREYDEQEKKVKALYSALDKAKTTYGENSNQVKDWQIKLNNAQAELTKLDRELQTNDKYLDEAKKSTDGTTKSIDAYGREVKDSKEETKDFNEELSKVKAGVANFGKVAGGAIAGVGAALIGVTESTKEFRTDFAKLETNTKTAGANIGEVSKELKNLDAITGETDSNIEALSNLMQAGFKGDSLTQAVDGLSGAVIKFPDTLKIESLSDSLEETIATGKSVGQFGELLERLGYNLDDFNKGLAECTSESERQQYAMNTLAKTGLSDVNKAYRANNKELIDNAEAQFEIRESMSKIATAVAPSLNKAMGKLAEGMETLSEDALPGVVDGLGWMVDNSDLVIAGLAGIGAAMLTQSAVTAITSAVGAFQSFKVATEGATVAQWALNAAQTANPIGLITAAVVGLSAALVVYASQQDFAKSELESFSDKLEESKKKSKELSDELQKTEDKYKTNTAEVKNNYGAVQILSDKLYTLSDKENKSNAEKVQMQALVNQLNDSIPDLNLELDKQNGLLNKQKEETDNLIDSMKDKALAQVYEERYLEIAKAQVKAQEELMKQEELKEEAQEKYNEAKTEQAEIEQKIRDNQMDPGYLEGAIINTNDWKTSLDGATDAVDKQSEMISKYDGQFKTLDDTLGKTTDSTSTYSSTTSQALAEAEVAYESAKETAIDSIQSQIDIFDKFSESSEVTKEELLANLKSQVEGISEWATNIEELSNRGINEGLLADLKEMGPSAAAEIAALNDMSDKELQKYSKTWEELGDATKKGAEATTSDLKKVYNNAYDEAQKDSEKAGKENIASYNSGVKEKQQDAEKLMASVVKNTIAYASTNSSTKAKGLGESIADGIKSGVKNRESTLGSTMASLAESMLSSFKKKLKINSPSKVFEEQAEWIPEGAAKGIRNKIGVATGAMQSLTDSLTLGDIPTDYDIGFSSSINTNLNDPNISESNGLGSLMDAISNLANRPIVLTVNGREFALATAQDMSVELNSLNRMGSRRIGVVN